MKHVQTLNNGMRSSKNLTATMEEDFSRIAASTFHENWNEVNVLQDLVSTLGNSLHNQAIKTPTGNFTISWRNYRHGKPDPDHASTWSLVTSIKFHDGQYLEGVHLVSMKVRESEKNSFAGLRKDHTKKYHSITPCSSLVLMDYDPVAGMAFPASPETIMGNQPHSWSSWIPYTNAAAVSTGSVIALSSKNTGLYRTSVPLSYLLAYRLFNGLDLDHSKSALEICTGNKPEKLIPGFISYIHISYVPGITEYTPGTVHGDSSYETLQA